jgi:putative NADH-flavin reductase
MNIVVFGATGNIGARVVSRLLQRGDTVTAFVHHSLHLPQDPKLVTVKGDIYNADDVERAVAGADIVVSALGSWGTKNKDVLTVGMKHIIPAMEKAGVKRIVSLTGSGVLLTTDKASWYDHLNPLLLQIVAPQILSDGKEHIRLLATSQLDWTVIRSPVMKNGRPHGYNLQDRPPALWTRVCRDDVAQAMVDLAHLTTDEYSKKAPFIT